MRIPKKNTTELGHLIEDTWEITKKGRDINSSEQAEIIAAIGGTLYFLEILDAERMENHKTYFIKRYLSLHNNMTQLQISNEYCISRDSLSSYCAMYLRVFARNLDIMKRREKDLNGNNLIIRKFFEDLSVIKVQNRKRRLKNRKNIRLKL